jgi:CheY-like chemotaxis protein
MSKIVLHVDDSATMQMVADITFRGTDYTFVGARSVDEALEKAKLHRPTLVLADSHMPGKSGYDLCLAMKSDPTFADVPVVIMCGNAQPFDVARGGMVGADGSLPKPWDSQVMLEKVGEVVEKAALGVSKPGSVPMAAAPAPAVVAAAAPVAAQAATGSKGVPQPPRSATIMGMPTIKMPAGTAPTVPVTSATPAAAVPAAAPVRPSPASSSAAVARAAAPAPAPAMAAPVVAAAVPAAVNRPPMVASTPTKRSMLVERTLAKMAARLSEATGLAAGSPELLALLKLSTEVVERVVWEVVPELAEHLIRENLEQLIAARRN